MDGTRQRPGLIQPQPPLRPKRQLLGEGDGANLSDEAYERRRLSYANTFEKPW